MGTRSIVIVCRYPAVYCTISSVLEVIIHESRYHAMQTVCLRGVGGSLVALWLNGSAVEMSEECGEIDRI